jgi:hypothetical protein
MLVPRRRDLIPVFSRAKLDTIEPGGDIVCSGETIRNARDIGGKCGGRIRAPACSQLAGLEQTERGVGETADYGKV